MQNYSQANEKSISGERFFIRLRLICRSAVNDFVFFCYSQNTVIQYLNWITEFPGKKISDCWIIFRIFVVRIHAEASSEVGVAWDSIYKEGVYLTL